MEKYKDIDEFIGGLANIVPPNKTDLNIYNGSEGEYPKIRRVNLRFYLEKMKKRNPSRLFVGLAPGRLGCFWTGIPFTDIETLIGNKFFQKRKKELVDSILRKEFKRKEIEELKNFIISYCKDKKDDIENIFRNNSFEKRKEELKKSINEYYKNKGIKKRVALVCSIINLHREKEIKFEIEEIRERAELVCSIIDSCKENGFMINDISELTSSTVWECLDKLDLDQLPLLWNIYPFQPWEYGKNGKKNRTPEDIECDVGVEFLKYLLDFFPSIKHIYAVGHKAESALKRANFQNAIYICHPAARKDGRAKFREKFNEIYGIESEEPKNQKKKD